MSLPARVSRYTPWVPIVGSHLLFTGGAGFIGTTLAGRLADQNTIVLYDNMHRDAFRNTELGQHPNVTLVIGDVLDRDRLRSASASRSCQTLGVNPMTDVAQSVTLIAATIGAVAAVTGVVVTSRNARRIAKETATAIQRREDHAFRRQRLAAMKDMLFESALALQSLSACCNSIPWLTKTPLEELHERGETHISRINYAAQIIQTMSDEVEVQNGLLAGLAGLFHGFCGAIYFYKQQISIGNIEQSGQVKHEAKEADARFETATRDWNRHILDLRELVTGVCSKQEAIRDDA